MKQIGGTVRHDTTRPGKPVMAVELRGPLATDAALKVSRRSRSLNRWRWSTPRSATPDWVRWPASAICKRSISSAATPATWICIAQKPEGLKTLVLNTPRVTDEGLKSLAGLSTLESLQLHGTQVTGAGLKSLVGLPRLEALDLRGARLSDAGLATLDTIAGTNDAGA